MIRQSVAVLVLVLAAGCEREDREYRPDPTVPDVQPAQETLAFTGAVSDAAGAPSIFGQQFEANAYHVAQGKRLFSWFNCVGCHANGGGGSGPALMDEAWRYGGSIDEIASSIREGRPNGMPPFQDRATDDQVWQLAAYVRSLGGNLAIDVAPGRNDDLSPHPPENQLEQRPPVATEEP